MKGRYDGLRGKVLEAVEEQRQHPALRLRRHEQVLAEFIALQLAKSPLTETQFVQRLNLAEAEVERLLQGTLPREAITRDILQRVADVLGCDVHLLWIILYGPDAKPPLIV